MQLIKSSETVFTKDMKYIYEKKRLKMELERENVTRSNTEWYLGFIWNYEKEEEEGQRGDKDKIFAYNNSDRNRS